MNFKNTVFNFLLHRWQPFIVFGLIIGFFNWLPVHVNIIISRDAPVAIQQVEGEAARLSDGLAVNALKGVRVSPQNSNFGAFTLPDPLKLKSEVLPRKSDLNFNGKGRAKFATFDEIPPFNIKIEDDRLTDKEIALWLLKSAEGFSSASYWDVNRYTSGFGTTAKNDERITLEEAHDRTNCTFDKKYASISDRYPNLDEWTKLILTVMDYNLTKGFGTKLEAAIATGDKYKIANKMRLYVNNAKGEFMEGLANRREAEIEVLLVDPKYKQEVGRELRNSALKKVRNSK